MRPILFILLVLLLMLGSWGWGRAAVVLLGRLGWADARRQLGPSFQIILGVALFLAVGGYLVAVGLAVFPVLALWHVLGAAFLVVSLARARSPRRLTRHPPPALITAALTISSLVVVVAAIGRSLGSTVYNSTDDDPAYIYLAKRLLSTGRLIDPFNLRRLTQYGGSTLYQSMFLHVSGNASLRGYEYTFGALLLLITALRTVRRSLLWCGVLGLGVAILFGHGTVVGSIGNLGPTFSASALALGAYQVIDQGPTDGSRDPPGRYATLGLMLAGVLAMRSYYLVGVGIAAGLVIIAFSRGHVVRHLGLVAMSGVVASSGWAISSYQSSGTPAFPLLAGNYDTGGIGVGRPPRFDFSVLFDRYVQALRSADQGAIIFWCIAIAVLYLVVSERHDRRMIVVLAGALGCLSELAVLVYSLPGSEISGICRFEAPATLALALFTMGSVWPERQGPGSPAAGLAARLRAAIGQRDPHTRRLLGQVAVASVVPLMSILVLCACTFGDDPSWLASTTGTNVRLGVQVVAHRTGLGDRYAPYRAEYERATAVIPDHAKVLAAVEYPALLSFTKYTFATLDGAGSVSPPPHMPYFRGAMAKVQYLRRLGYTYIVSQAPDVPGLYDRNMFLDEYLRNSIYFTRVQGAYFVDWAATVRTLELSPRFHTTYVGQLAVIRIAGVSSAQTRTSAARPRRARQEQSR